MTITKKAATFVAKDGTMKQGEYIIALPNAYNMATPYKLAFGMGGYTRDALDCLYGDCWGFASAGHKAGAIVVVITQFNPGVLHPPQTADPNNAPVKTGWDATNEIENNVALFRAVKADVQATTCVDTKHVFAVGGSAGGIFAQYLGCRLGDELRGIASVGGCMGNTLQPTPIGTNANPPYMRGQENPMNVCLNMSLDFKSCRGNVAMVMVHGFKDSHVPWADSKLTFGAWVPKNGCGAGATTPMSLDQVHTYTTAGANRIMCVDAPGCATDYPTRWCEHSEGGYDGTTHGWPSGQIGNSDGAGKYIWDFWNSLK
jgi:poly(3-hydroxybutyrate) depolymerase